MDAETAMTKREIVEAYHEVVIAMAARIKLLEARIEEMKRPRRSPPPEVARVDWAKYLHLKRK